MARFAPRHRGDDRTVNCRADSAGSWRKPRRMATAVAPKGAIHDALSQKPSESRNRAANSISSPGAIALEAT
jgi:hypothetical protein